MVVRQWIVIHQEVRTKKKAEISPPRCKYSPNVNSMHTRHTKNTKGPRSLLMHVNLLNERERESTVHEICSPIN